MNLLLLSGNKQRKVIEPLFKNTPHTILGNEAAIKGTTVSRILDHYAPHIVVLCDDVVEKGNKKAACFLWQTAFIVLLVAQFSIQLLQGVLCRTENRKLHIPYNLHHPHHYNSCRMA